MKKELILMTALGVLGLMACKGGEAESTNEVEEKAQTCMYTYDHGVSTFEWTAYKTSAKVPVKGSFNEIEVSGETSSDDLLALLESLSFTMNTSSVETNDESRNQKIAELFFGVMENTQEITGNVKSVDGEGNATIEVTMNGATQDVVGTYVLEDGLFAFTATIDVSAWNALEALASLNDVCKELHTGDDGVSKTWSEVALSFSTQLKMDCE